MRRNNAAMVLALAAAMTMVQSSGAADSQSASAAGGSDKPSPVPSRIRKQERARALASGQADSNPMAAVWSGSSSRPTEPVHWDGPQSGTAVYFSSNLRGKTSASGVVMDPDDMTAGHASLPFGTVVKVTNMKNGKEVSVRIVDRINENSPHIISVSERAATELGFRRDGIGSVRIMPIQTSQEKAAPAETAPAQTP